MKDRRTITPAKPARGTVEGDRRKIAIGFPKQLFDQINYLAKFNGRSFNEQTIVMCESAIRGPVYLTRVGAAYQVRVR